MLLENTFSKFELFIHKYSKLIFKKFIKFWMNHQALLTDARQIPTRDHYFTFESQ